MWLTVAGNSKGTKRKKLEEEMAMSFGNWAERLVPHFLVLSLILEL
jgi:hypothetical protein